METTLGNLVEMTEIGRLVVPAEARRLAGVKGKRAIFMVEVVDGDIILRPVEIRPKSKHKPSPRALERMEAASQSATNDVTREEIAALADVD